MSATSLPVTKRSYSRLSEVLTIDDLPDFLSFVEDGLNDLFDSIYYKNLQYSKSARGDSAFYSIEIITNKVGVDLPFGLRLVLNPDDGGNTDISSFPIALQYQWEILAFLRSFNVQLSDLTPEGLYHLGLQIFNISEPQVLENIINLFSDQSQDLLTRFQQIVNDINTKYPAANLSLPVGQTPTVSSLVALIKQNIHIPVGVSALLFAIYILDGDLEAEKDKLEKFYTKIVPGGIENYIQKLIKPKIKATLTLSAGLEFPTSILQPVNADGSLIPNEKSIFKFGSGTFYVDTEAGIGSDLVLSGSLFPTFAQIANTGLIVELKNAKLDLSKTTNIPEATAAGYPVDFIGLYVEQTSVTFTKFGQDNPDKPSATISADNLFVGTGGVSGKISLADNGLLHRKFGNFEVELDKFSITFRQNSIVDSTISGKITLPSGFSGEDQQASVIQIDGHIMDNGDFSITGTFLGTPPTFEYPNVFKVSISKLELGEKGGHFYLSVAGKLDFTADIPVLGDVLPKGIVINKFIIWDDGHIEFDGGKLTVPKAFRLKVGPVSLEVSNLTLGSHKRIHDGIERNYYFIGFDGMLNAGNAGIGVGGNGLKYYFTNDDGPGKPFDQYLSIDGIEIDLSIPAQNPNFILHGFLSMKNPDESGAVTETEYVGMISVSLPKLRIAGSAAMRLKPSIPSFIVDIDLELPTAIPLGPTGLGIYGFRGLIGQHYIPSKAAVKPALPEDATWWDYYKAPSAVTHRQGVEIDKFDDQKSGFSLGIGASIATEFDTGFIFSSKVFLLLGLPDVFLIQGQAAIISERLGLDDDRDPPFSALIVIGDNSVQGALSVDFFLPGSGADKGSILGIKAELDLAFFFNNASGWYLNIGKDTPKEAQVMARPILTLFTGHAYLMISSHGIKAGAGISYDFNRKFGPVQVGFGAALDMGGFISFKPVQIGGFIQVSGYAFLKVWKFKFGLTIAIALAMEAPHPFNITGSLKVKLNLPWPIPDIKFTLDVSWHFNDDVDLTQVPVLSVPDPATGYLPAAGINILSNESFPLNYVTAEDLTTIPPPGDPVWKYNFTDAEDVLNVIIPLDTFVDIGLLKPVMPGNAQVGGSTSQLPDGYAELIPPVKGVKAQVKHQYELKELGLYAWNEAGSAWVPYNVYEAVTAIVDGNTGDNAVDLSQLKPGYWQFVDKDKYNKIRLLSQNMFSFSNGTITDQLDMDARGFRAGDVFCFDQVLKTSVVNWKDVASGTAYPGDVPVPVQALMFTFSGLAASVKNETDFGANSLFLDGGNGSVTILFPEQVASLKLEFGDNANNIAVEFIEPVYKPGDFGQAVFTDTVVGSAALSAAQQNGVITYDHVDQPVSKVRLSFAAAAVSGYTGDLVLGGHLQLPATVIPVGLNGSLEADRALLFSALYDRSFTASEILALEQSGQPGLVGQWPMDTPVGGPNGLNGIVTGSPGTEAGFYQTNAGQFALHDIYRFTANEDGMVIPDTPEIGIENASFAVEVSVTFNPFAAGISTLLYRVTEDGQTGARKGYALHLLQATPAHAFTSYPAAAIPEFTILFTCYDGLAYAAVSAGEKYTVNCSDGTAAEKQYKRVLVSVNRETGKLEIFIDRVLKASADIPAELGVAETPAGSPFTYLNQVTYTTESMQARQADNPVTNTDFINEVAVLDDTINKTVQPVWRPDTTFAVRVKTFDRVNNTQTEQLRTHIFGFRTKGPLGHYHQFSKAYQALADGDQQDAFKLANLKNYINYDRSFPDAQGRYDLSKPVFYHNPQVKLYFDQPYINAMYADWASYEGLPGINSTLELQLLDPAGTPITQHLVWAPVQEIPVDETNYTSLTRDQQLIYLFNQVASHGGCNPLTNNLVKKLTQGSYQFDDLLPATFYTARFNAVYQPEGADADSVEVHKFGFITSRYATFQEQAGSYVLDATPGAEKYMLHVQPVAFDADYIAQILQKLINDDLTDDPDAVMKYAVRYERLIYGGLNLAAPEPLETTAIVLIVNSDPTDQSKKLLGILVYNPEPFNEPKLPAESVPDTIGLTLGLADGTKLQPASFINIYARDNSAVLITNTAMDIPSGNLQLGFRYKIFNGVDYETNFEEYEGPLIDLSPWFS